MVGHQKLKLSPEILWAARISSEIWAVTWLIFSRSQLWPMAKQVG